MQHRRLGFVKRGPVPRAARIRRLQRESSVTRLHNNRALPNLLKSILSVVKDSSQKTSSTLSKLVFMIQEVPPWLLWSSKEDALMKNLSDQYETERDDVKGQTPYSEQEEDILCKYLIKLNGNHPYMEEFDFRLNDPELMIVYNMWLQYRSADDNPLAHIKNEAGDWITDAEAAFAATKKKAPNLLMHSKYLVPISWLMALTHAVTRASGARADYLKNGWFLHLPTRTLQQRKSITRLAERHILTHDKIQDGDTDEEIESRTQ